MSERRLEFVHTKLVRDSWVYPAVYITGSNDAVSAIQSLIGDLDKEVCAMLNLTTHNQVINASFVSMGTINASLLNPPEVFRNALLSGASKIILVHNHPSGVTTPSSADRNVARRMAQAGRLVGVDVVDFIIVTPSDAYSFAKMEPGCLNPEEGEYIPTDDMEAGIADAGILEDEAAVYSAYERLKKDRRTLVDSILEKIRDGDVFSSPLWSQAAVSPRNPISSAVYQGGNRLILMNRVLNERYTDPRWMTYAQLSSKGYAVKKGEHGTRLEKWIFTKRVKDTDGNGKIIEKEALLPRPYPCYFTVFNAEQVAGFPAFDPQNAALFTSMDKGEETLVNALIQSSECPVIECAQDRSFYRPSSDEIYLPRRDVFRSVSAFGHVLAHEMVHSTGHPSRLHRTFGICSPLSGPDENYCVEELRAELGSLFLTTDLGLFDSGVDIRNTAGYVEHYLDRITDAMDKNPSILFRAAGDAEKACGYLLKNLEKRLPLMLTKEIIPQKIRDPVKEKTDDEKELPPREAAFFM